MSLRNTSYMSLRGSTSGPSTAAFRLSASTFTRTEWRITLDEDLIFSPVSPEPAKTLKLYQPASQRFYVAAATLACAIPGLPDRTPTGGHERTGFVLRRLLPRTTQVADMGNLAEFAFVKAADGVRWQLVSADDPAQLAPGEELLPVFPLAHGDSAQVRRRIWGGLVPVGRREEYMAGKVSRDVVSLVAGQTSALRPPPPAPPRDSTIARMTEFKMDVAEPWKMMIRTAQKAAGDIAADRGDPDTAGVDDVRRQARAREANLKLRRGAQPVVGGLELGDFGLALGATFEVRWFPGQPTEILAPDRQSSGVP